MSDFKLGWDKLRRLLSSPLTWTGIQTFTSLVATTADINGGTIDDTTIGVTTPAVLGFLKTLETITAHGNTGTTAQEIDLAVSSYHTMTVTGAFTLSFANWTSGKVSAVTVKFINGGSAVITYPGAVAGTDPVLQASGTDFVVFWSDDNGSTIYYSMLSIL